MDKDNDIRLQEQYELGNLALKATQYFEEWLAKKKEKVVREMASAKTQEELVPLWQRFKVLQEFDHDLHTDIETGELAINEMEEDQ